MEDVANIVMSIKGNVWTLVHDHNGNHVVQKSCTKLNEYLHQVLSGTGRNNVSSSTSQDCDNDDDEDQQDDKQSESSTHQVIQLLRNSLDVIIDEVTSKMKEMAIHPYGCRVVQRLIEYCTGSQKVTVLNSILNHHSTIMPPPSSSDASSSSWTYDTLINHEYGNYVIQRILAYGRSIDKSAIYETISGKIVSLSRMKHSSNVVEMMLTYGNDGQRHQIIDEILNVSKKEV